MSEKRKRENTEPIDSDREKKRPRLGDKDTKESPEPEHHHHRHHHHRDDSRHRSHHHHDRSRSRSNDQDEKAETAKHAPRFLQTLKDTEKEAIHAVTSAYATTSSPAVPTSSPPPTLNQTGQKLDVSSLLANLAASKAALKSQLEKKQQELTEQQQKPGIREAVEKAKAIAALSQKKLDESKQFKGGKFLPPPLLLDESGREVDELGRPIVKPALIAVTTTKANKKHLLATFLDTVAKETRDDITGNPHYDPSMARQKAIRSRKSFTFIEPGTFVKKAERMRNKAMKDSLAQQGKITDTTGATPMDDEEDEENPNLISLGSKSLQDDFDPVIPDVEWWDIPFLKQREYPDWKWSTPGWPESAMELPEDLVLQLSDTIVWARVTIMVEHPVLKQPPNEGKVGAPTPLMLTKAERKKLRKRERAERFKEQRERVLIGLEAPPKPKVKLSNLMRVLTSEAVQDPTEIERKVKAEVEQRKQNHEDRNQSRKLTKEQRKEKKKQKLIEDAKWACICSVFRVSDLSDSRRRYKVDITAQSLMLSGCAVVAPAFSVVVVEGGQKAINKYKKLMLKRIKWDEPSAPPNAPATTTTVPAATDSTAQVPPPEPTPVPQPTVKGTCCLVWEGQLLKPNFRNFVFENMKTDLMARRYLASKGAEHFWEMAKNVAAVQPEIVPVVSSQQ